MFYINYIGIRAGEVDGLIHSETIRCSIGRGPRPELDTEYVRDGQGEDGGGHERRRLEHKKDKAHETGRIRRVRSVAKGSSSMESRANGLRLQNQRRLRRQSRVAPDAVAALRRLPGPAPPPPPLPAGTIQPLAYCKISQILFIYFFFFSFLSLTNKK